MKNCENNFDKNKYISFTKFLIITSLQSLRSHLFNVSQNLLSPLSYTFLIVLRYFFQDFILHAYSNLYVSIKSSYIQCKQTKCCIHSSLSFSDSNYSYMQHWKLDNQELKRPGFPGDSEGKVLKRLTAAYHFP